MNKSHLAKSGKTAPNTLSKLGKKTGIELTEAQLGQVSGSLIGSGKHIKVGI